MERLIWVIGNNRQEMIDAQRRINSTGSMRTFCMLRFDAVKNAVARLEEFRESGYETGQLTNRPMLLVLDYEMSEQEDFFTLNYLKKQQSLAGVPLFFMMYQRTPKRDEICYEHGATVVLTKPFSRSGILRMERTAWQYEITKNYEKTLLKQATDLQASKEIMKLNQQLETRNQLLHQVLGRYFSEGVVDQILESPGGTAIGGEKRELTVLMADLRGFTSTSETMDPEDVTDILNHYYDHMVGAITAYKGIVIEFMGDGILAVFGALDGTSNQAGEAVAAAICMQNAMGDINDYCQQKQYPMLEIGIGIHSGEVFIGNVGSEKMIRYNVIGAVVNECSRIEGHTVGGQILASEETISKIRDIVEYTNQTHVTAKGIQKPMFLYEVLGIGGEYDCNIKNVSFDVLHDVNDWILLNLYPIRGKMIQNRPVCAVLQKFSRKRARAKLLEANETLPVFSDVEIFAAGENGQAKFTGVYAKIMKSKDGELLLHFTHINQNFIQFSKQILE